MNLEGNGGNSVPKSSPVEALLEGKVSIGGNLEGIKNCVNYGIVYLMVIVRGFLVELYIYM